jgi:serine/threonine-protein kinase HipA
MMTSDRKTPDNAFVWVWLPGETEPVVAGRLSMEGSRYIFNYGVSYLERANAIPLHEPELPLRRGRIDPLPNMALASCLRDASPDAWGRRVIINRLVGPKAAAQGAEALNELSYLLESGSDRIGALDFQASATEYVPRLSAQAGYQELLDAAECVERGLPLPPALDQAIHHGTSIGGARPKSLIDDDGRKLIAKFSSSTDLYSVVKAEFMAMRLATECGLDVAPVSIFETAGKDVLLIERFDRIRTDDGWQRRAMVSALTMLKLNELEARYASYEDLAELVRHNFTAPRETLRELYGRICFNVLCGNTDDHARNHAAFWDGQRLTLTPAYDICPQSRAGDEASHAMLIKGQNRMSTLATCLSAAPDFHLREDQATALIEAQIETIAQRWSALCDEAALTPVDARLFAGRQFLNPYCTQGLGESHEALRERLDEARARIIRQSARYS